MFLKNNFHKQNISIRQVENQPTMQKRHGYQRCDWYYHNIKDNTNSSNNTANDPADSNASTAIDTKTGLSNNDSPSNIPAANDEMRNET